MGTFLFLPSITIGGMEKRFFEVWHHLVRHGYEVTLVTSRKAYSDLQRRPDIGQVEDNDPLQLVDIATNSTLDRWRALVPIIRSIPPHSTVHYLLHAPPFIHRALKHRMILSWVASRPPGNRQGLAGKFDWGLSAISLRQADVIDVLNPEVLQFLDRNPALRSKLRLTRGGTFVDLKHFSPAAKRRNTVVFLGCLMAERNAVLAVEASACLSALLGNEGWTMQLLGPSGDQQKAVAALLNSDRFRGVPVTLGYTHDPAAVLANAKVFLSIQRTSNYPSKALAEALACGCVPIITDTGESRRMASPQSSVFVPADCSPQVLAEKVAGLLNLPADEFSLLSAHARRHAETHFVIDSQAAYFAELYART